MQKLRKKLTVGLAALLAVVMVSGNSASALSFGSVQEDAFNAYNNAKYFFGNQTEAFKADPIGYALCDVVANGGKWLYTAYTMKEIDFKNNGLFSNIGSVLWRVTPFSHFGKKLLLGLPCTAYRAYQMYDIYSFIKAMSELQTAKNTPESKADANAHQGDVVNEVEL